MKAIAGVLRELAGLFVDDGALAALALVWIAAAWWLLPLVVGPVACSLLLFAGLAVALAASVLRA